MNHQVFLSHSSTDKDLVRSLADALTRRGVTPWLDVDHLAIGEPIAASLEAAMEECVAVAVVLSPRSLASPWVEEELARARQLERQSRARILPLFLEITTQTLREDPRFTEWFRDDRLDRIYVCAEEHVDRLADETARAVGRLAGMAEAESVMLVCDPRGRGSMTGAPVVRTEEWPTFSFRPCREERTPTLTLTSDAWQSWRDDMDRGLIALLRQSPLREVRLHLRAQLAVGVFFGTHFDRQSGVHLEVFDAHSRDRPWRAVSGHRPGAKDGGGLVRLDDSEGDVTTLLVHRGDPDHRAWQGARTWHAEHRDGPLYGHSYADRLVEGLLPADTDVVAWAKQVVADLAPVRPTHLRLILDAPIWFAVALGQLLTRIEVPHLTVLDWDQDMATYGECHLR